MSDEIYLPTFIELEAIKSAERIQIAEELRAGVKPVEQVAREHQPWAQSLGASLRPSLGWSRSGTPRVSIGCSTCCRRLAASGRSVFASARCRLRGATERLYVERQPCQRRDRQIACGAWDGRSA
jgi:deoxycytidylate deaminase